MWRWCGAGRRWQKHVHAFFEEMTVYAPVPVPVNGNTHYTSESIERLPTGNGNISDLLRTNPAVRMDSTQSTSLNQEIFARRKSLFTVRRPIRMPIWLTVLVPLITWTQRMSPMPVVQPILAGCHRGIILMSAYWTMWRFMTVLCRLNSVASMAG